jgi:hypothetical protein
LIFTFLKKTLEVGPAMVSARKSENCAAREFRADAKADGDSVGVGGWLCHPDGTEHSPWFSLQLTKKTAPWAFRAGEPFRAIASLELYATLLCAMLLPWNDGEHDGGVCSLSGMTDNRGNSFAVSKLMTTKFPLCAFLMELTALLATKGTALDLHWLPRDQNVEADELSNGITRRFRPENEVKVVVADLKFLMLEDLLDTGEQLYSLVDNAKKKRAVLGPMPPRKVRRKPESRLRVTRPW